MPQSTTGAIRSFESILLDGSFDDGTNPQFLAKLEEYQQAVNDTGYEPSPEVSDALRDLADSGVLSEEEQGALDDVIADTDQAPTITSDGGADEASLFILENTTVVTDVDASDPEGDTLTYSISGGTDAGLFDIDPTTGVLNFLVAPDFENPNDTNADGSDPDGTYQVEVTVDDGYQGTDTQTVNVTVTDAPEAAIDVFMAQGNLNEILLNNGDGTFVGSFADDALQSTQGVALGDFNNDGHLDAYVSNGASVNNNDQILLGNGDGTFTEELTPLPFAGEHHIEVELGDFNEDGNLDAFVTSYLAPSRVLLGDGDGTFSAGPAVPGGLVFTEDVAIYDFNGDGHLDALVTQSGTSQVLLGDGTGAFAVNWTLSGPSSISGGSEIGLADFNDDGYIDAYVAVNGYLPDENNVLQPQPDFILWGNGDGTFSQDTFPDGSGTPPLPPSGAEQAEGVSVGDLNGDGNWDVFVVNWDAPNKVLLGDGSGGFTEAATPVNPALAESPIGGNDSYGVSLADFDGDGDLDAIVTNQGPDEILFNDGTGDFTEGEVLPTLGVNTFVAGLGDLNEDGSVAAVDGNGLPNINSDGLLPDLIA
jgi:FG-GAP-like repeat/Bacterial Ig domain